ILRRAQNSGRMTIALTAGNGGAAVVSEATIVVKEPARDVWVQRNPRNDEKPADNQLYARDDSNEGTVYYNGVLTNASEAVFVKLYADGKLIRTEKQKPVVKPVATPAVAGAEYRYAFTLKLKPGLIKYRIDFGANSGGGETVLRSVTNLVCGDAYLIDGQSNALATDWGQGECPDTSEWVRSFGSNNGDISSGWGNAVRRHGAREIGCWGMDLAKRLVEDQKMPICIINGAAGGTLIEVHQRNPAKHAAPDTIYGRMLNRVETAGLTHGIRGAFWHQGENNQGTQGETGGYGWETYEQYFVDMVAAWKQDYPNIQHYYVFQIWPNSCSMGGTRASDKLRDVQRLLPRLYSNMSIMSTLGIKPVGPCHFPPAGYAEIARLICAVVERDNYGKVCDKPVTAPDLKKAYFTSDKRDEIALEFDQPMEWDKALVSEFYMDGGKGIVDGAAAGNIVKLKLIAASDAKTITYLVDSRWDDKKLLYGQNGIAALTFFEVPIGK
ncbi:MAG: sialate O-acetylesterase, partial [bacterium]